MGQNRGWSERFGAKVASSDLIPEGISGSDMLRGSHCSNPGGGWESGPGQAVEAEEI